MLRLLNGMGASHSAVIFCMHCGAACACLIVAVCLYMQRYSQFGLTGGSAVSVTRVQVHPATRWLKQLAQCASRLFVDQVGYFCIRPTAAHIVGWGVGCFGRWTRVRSHHLCRQPVHSLLFPSDPSSGLPVTSCGVGINMCLCPCLICTLVSLPYCHAAEHLAQP